VHRTSYKYQLSDWDSFRSYLREVWKFYFCLLTNALVNHWVDSSWYWCFCIANIIIRYLGFHMLALFLPLFPSLCGGNSTEILHCCYKAIARQSSWIPKNLLKQRSQHRNLILVTSGRFSTVFNNSTIISLFDIAVHLLVTVFCLSLINIFLKNLKTFIPKSHGWSVKLAIMIFGVRSKIILTYGRFDKNISYMA